MSVIIVISMLLTILNSDIILSSYAEERVAYGEVVAGGNGYSLFIDDESNLYSYGSNDYGQLGNGSNDYAETPSIIMKDVRAVYSGKDHVLVIDKENNLYSFGHNDSYQLGDGANGDRNKPVRIMTDIKSVSAGDGYTLALSNNGKLFGFGKNDVGQLGLKIKPVVKQITFIMDGVKEVSTGLNHSFVVLDDGRLLGFGSNQYHKINSSDVAFFDEPIELMKDVKTVSAGAEHSLVVKENFDLYGFGNNSLKQLSDDLLYVVNEPVLIMNNVLDVKTGFSGNIIRKTDGSVMTFGKFFNDERKNGEPFHKIDFPVASYSIGFNDTIYALKPVAHQLEYDYQSGEYKKLLNDSAFKMEYMADGHLIDYSSAKKLYSRKLFNGVSKDEFEPALMKKASALEALVIIGRAFEWDVDKSISETEFSDVTSWAAPYVRYAVDNGLTSGIGNGLFGADILDGKRIFTWIVSELGEDKSDVWSNPEYYEEKVGIDIPSSAYRSDLVTAVYQALIRKNSGLNSEVIDGIKEKIVGGDEAVINWTGSKDNKPYNVEARLLEIKSETIKLEEEYKNRKLIAITFDDGPSVHTERLLNALKKYDAKSTFFVLGTCASVYPQFLVRMRDEGHEIANHSFIHPDLSRMSWSGVVDQIDHCDAVIRSATGVETTLVRPPYGAYNRTVRNICKQKNKSIIMWDIDTRDWQYKDRHYVKRYIVLHAKENSIMLLHDLHSTSVDGFIDALPVLVENGYKLVTVTELMKHNNKKLVPGQVYSSGR